MPSQTPQPKVYKSPSVYPSTKKAVPLKKRKWAALLLAMILLASILFISQNQILGLQKSHRISIDQVLGYSSTRADGSGPDIIIASAADPFYSIIATPTAVWYDKNSPDTGYGLRPFFVVDKVASDPQMRFESMMGIKTALVIGKVDSGISNENVIDMPAPEASLEVAKLTYTRAPGAMLVTYDQDGYAFMDSAAVLSSYLNIPILVVHKNQGEISDLLHKLHVKYIITVGHDAEGLSKTFQMPTVVLDCQKSIRAASLRVVQDRFGRIDYMVMSNPSDVIPPSITNIDIQKQKGQITDMEVLLAGNNVVLSGTRTDHYNLTLKPGIQLVKIWANVTAVNSYFKRVKKELGVQPIISIEIRDSEGNIVSYSPSIAYATRSAYTEFLLVNCTTDMDLAISMWYGTKGFSTMLWGSSGYTKVDAEYELTIETDTLSSPHWPLLEDDSLMAPYIAAAHGGIVLAGPGFELTDENYASMADGAIGGPWYNENQSSISSDKAVEVVMVLNETVESFKAYTAYNNNGTLFDSYTAGHGWLAILGDPNMIPFYYWPTDPSWKDDPIYGVNWPGDLIYSYNGTLSLGRLMGQTVSDVSVQEARTLFYQEYTNAYIDIVTQNYPAGANTWNDHYGLLYGEAGGQTGAIFWQDPFTKELAQHGWFVEKYGASKSKDRQAMEAAGAYEKANFFEIMLHGNWYWYVPEENGADSYSTAVKVSDVKDWQLGPMTFLTAACLMGRTDGVPPETQISMAFVHAGVNAVFSATRSTGQESSTREIERDLMYSDVSVGEALRDQKNSKPEAPTLYVRVLYGDPAFNPYEPENGFSDQGRPILVP
jgi:hypothetical protein